MLRQQYRFARLLEQIHNRRAAEPECACRDAKFDKLSAISAFERRNHEQQFGARACIECAQRLRQSTHIHEQKFLRKAEQFLQQRVTGQRAPRIRQQHLVVAETHRRDRVGVELDRCTRWVVGITDNDARATVDQQFVDGVRDVCLSGDMQSQRIESNRCRSAFSIRYRRRHLQLAEAQPFKGGQLDAQRAHGVTGACTGAGAVGCGPFGSGNCRRPEHRVIAGAKTTLQSLHGARMHFAAAWNEVSAGQLTECRIEFDLDHRE